MTDSAEKSRDFAFTDREFNLLRELITKNTGIVLAEHKRDMVYGRLSRRLRQLGLTTFSQYCELVSGDDTNEIVHLINAITTNLTAFFREPHHFDYLKNVVIPELIKTKSHNQKVRIWSAGCSTGEEPYSLAIAAKECFSALPDWDVRILATDLDSNVIETARAGIYKRERINGMSVDRMRRWFKRGTGNNDGLVKVSDEIHDIIEFRQLNLLHDWPMHGPMDIIFCRNVVIYFDKDTQKKLFKRYAELLAEHGYLFIGHSESLFRISDDFKLIGQTIYKKDGSL